MEVYVVTNMEDGWDCVRGVFSSSEKVAEYFTDLKIEYFDEDSGEFGGRLEKDFTGMSIDAIDEFLSDNSDSFCIHTEELK